MKFLQRSSFLCAACGLSLMIAAAEAGKLYKWVDADGNISYQDSPPPNNAKVIRETELKATGTANDNPQSDVPPLVVYTIEECDGCEMLMLRLKQLSLPYEEQSLLSKDIQAAILSDSDSLTAPTLRVGDQYISEFEEPEFITVLQKAGYKPNLRNQQQRQALSPDSDSDEDALEEDELTADEE